MFGRNNRRYFISLSIALSLVASPLDFSSFLGVPFAKGDVVSNEDDDGNTYEEWSGTEMISGYRSIDSSVTVVVKPGTILEFEGTATLEVWGKFLIEGTPENPVILRKKNPTNPDESYSVTSFGTVRARNINVSGGGSATEAFLVGSEERPSRFLNRAQAEMFYKGAFSFIGGSFDIEGANFHDNAVGVFSRKSGAKVWRSKFSQNTIDIVTQGVSADV